MPIIMFADGSLTSSGIAVGRCEFGNTTPEVLHVERITTTTSMPIQNRLVKIFARINELIKQYNVTKVITEQKFLGRNTSVKVAIVMGKADAAIQLAAGVNNLSIGEFENGQIKFQIAQDKHADKEAVEKMVRLLFSKQQIVMDAINIQCSNSKKKAKIDDMVDAVAGLYTYNANPLAIKEA